VTTPDAIHAADERLQTILKAHVVGATVQDPASRPAGEDTAAAFTSAGAFVAPYDPETLCLPRCSGSTMSIAWERSVFGWAIAFSTTSQHDAAVSRRRRPAPVPRPLPRAVRDAPAVRPTAALDP